MIEKSMRLVMVEWDDALGCASDWEPLSEIGAPTEMLCRSVGWLLHDTPTCVVLVPHLTEFEDHMDLAPQGCGDMTIPRRAVRKIVDLIPCSEKFLKPDTDIGGGTSNPPPPYPWIRPDTNTDTDGIYTVTIRPSPTTTTSTGPTTSTTYTFSADQARSWTERSGKGSGWGMV